MNCENNNFQIQNKPNWKSWSYTCLIEISRRSYWREKYTRQYLPLSPSRCLFCPPTHSHCRSLSFLHNHSLSLPGCTSLSLSLKVLPCTFCTVSGPRHMVKRGHILRCYTCQNFSRVLWWHKWKLWYGRIGRYILPTLSLRLRVSLPPSKIAIIHFLHCKGPQTYGQKQPHFSLLHLSENFSGVLWWHKWDLAALIRQNRPSYSTRKHSQLL